MGTPHHDRPLVLIAERDQRVRDLQRFFLERTGLSVAFVEDGEAALASARELHPALVVTEILLPKLDGLTLCRRLREDPATQDIPVIVFSVLVAATRAREAGAQAFLRKPFVETTFLATVQNYVAVVPSGIMEQS